MKVSLQYTRRSWLSSKPGSRRQSSTSCCDGDAVAGTKMPEVREHETLGGVNSLPCSRKRGCVT
ncbi:hypothetical protein E2C01_037833 [Portunus trituberculatus]|uniref:Uncharacterized protein n=1 Tax=Portunus trituberculatus TaxID=210409 RepID=A0A5B7FG06_PORTR|nr:hypothetical protein [Portunus trituberculatus]